MTTLHTGALNELPREGAEEGGMGVTGGAATAGGGAGASTGAGGENNGAIGWTAFTFGVLGVGTLGTSALGVALLITLEKGDV